MSDSESGPEYDSESGTASSSETTDWYKTDSECEAKSSSSDEDEPVDDGQEEEDLVSSSANEEFAQKQLFVRKTVRLIRENCERLEDITDPEEDNLQALIMAILSMRDELIDVCKYLMGDRHPLAWSLIEEAVVGTENALAPWKHLFDGPPMVLELLHRLRNIIIDDGIPSNEPDEANSGFGDPAGEPKPNIGSVPQKRRMVEDEEPNKEERVQSYFDGENREQSPPPLELLDNFDRETSSDEQAAPAAASAANHTIAEDEPPLPKYLRLDNIPRSEPNEAGRESDGDGERGNNVSSAPLDLSIGRPPPPTMGLDNNTTDMSTIDEILDTDD